MNFGEKLKDLRTQKGWSQEELAKQMGVTRRTIGGYEAGTTYVIPFARHFHTIWHKPTSYRRIHKSAFSGRESFELTSFCPLSRPWSRHFALS